MIIQKLFQEHQNDMEKFRSQRNMHMRFKTSTR